MKIVLFGAGNTAKSFVRYCRNNIQMQDITIVGICDNDTGKQNKSMSGIKIQSPQMLAAYSDYDAVVICSNYYSEIVRQIKQEFQLSITYYSIEEFKIERTIKYNRSMGVERNHDVNSVKDILSTDSLVVYTGIFGDYDELKTPNLKKTNIKYVCFTDNCRLKSDYWDIQYVESESNPRSLGKKYKILPHLFFPEYETSIWVDASFLIKEDLAEMLREYQTRSPILLMPHYERVCAYEEAAECIKMSLDKKEIILKQMHKYYQEGFPVSNGLGCGGVIVRRHNDPLLMKAMECWYEEVMQNSLRDQLSLNYALWKNGLQYQYTDLYIYENKWFSNMEHKLC